MTIQENPMAKPSAAARCFGRYVTRLAILRMDTQCFLCVRRNAAINDSATQPQWWPGAKQEWTLPDVGRDGRCALRVLPVVLLAGHEGDAR
jgi:hypothetical protein